MSGFKETFTRTEGKEGNLQYDDTAFYFFFIAILYTIIIPIGYTIIKPILFNPAKSRFSNACPCKDCRAKIQNLIKKNKYDYIKFSYILKVNIFINQ